jgi:hypothetical protein
MGIETHALDEPYGPQKLDERVFAMWKPVLMVAAAGVGGYVIWQVVWTFLLPILGALLGFLWFAIKIGLVALAIWWVYRLITKNSKKAAAT